MWLIILMYAVFASSFPVAKILTTISAPIFLTGTRMLLGGSILLVYYTGYCRKKCLIYKHQYWTYAQIIIIGFYFNYIARFWATKYLTSVKACFIFNFSPLVTSVLSYWVFGDTVSKRQWLGYALGFGALVPILITSSPTEALTGEFWYISWPEIIMLFSLLVDCYKWILIRKIVMDNRCHPIMVNGLCMTIGGSIALLTALPIEGTCPVTSLTKFLAYLALYILISNVITFNVYSYLLRNYTATLLSLAGFVTPLFAILYGWLFLDEHISWHFLLSTSLLAIGLSLFYKDEIKKKESRIDSVISDN